MDLFGWWISTIFLGNVAGLRPEHFALPAGFGGGRKDRKRIFLCAGGVANVPWRMIGLEAWLMAGEPPDSAIEQWANREMSGWDATAEERKFATEY